MAKHNPDQIDLFNDWLVTEQPVMNSVTKTIEDTLPVSFDELRHVLAMRLAEKLGADGEITSKFLTTEANRAFGGSQAQGTYLSKDAYDALEAAFNIHLLKTEDSGWTAQNAEWARLKTIELTNRIQKLPTQTRRDEEMDEFQQFSTPPALSFVANWVANVGSSDVMAEPSAGTGDLAVWSVIAGAAIVLNELSPRRQALLSALFPQAKLFKENAEQLDNVLPPDIAPTVIVMNPPFSSTAGRVQGQRDTSNGARHIEQALKRLDDGGRLVAIVGNGMAMDRPAFSQWWKDMQQKYNVLANIGISGKEYAKYGTTFDNQILVIDKTGPTQIPILVGQVESVADLPTLLESIRNERQPIQSKSIKSKVITNTQPQPDTLQPGNESGGDGAREDGIGIESIGNRDNRGTVITDSETGGVTGIGNVANDGIRTRGEIRSGSVGNREPGGSGSNDNGGNSRISESNSTATITVEIKSGEVSEFTDSIFSNYTPQRLTISGAKQHPGKLVQSAAMSAVEPPAPTYAPVLPSNLIHDGLLSIAQLEAVVYSGQAHSELLPNGSRKGFFIGDGTGVGKGREISGIILDNMMQGRNKAVWVSFNEGLIEDARRDFAGVGGDPGKIFFQGKTKAGNEITHADGILFTTYSTLRGGEKKQANDLGQTGGKSRAQQIIDWLGKDFDGVIAFDEAHSMGNAIAVRGKRGAKKPSQQAIAGINLQRELPNARVTYVSATGATEISNLSYADRLGLWGEGTPFADTNAFIDNVSKGGIASMELISRDMKAMGMYLARSLSYDGVTYERLEHTLSELQEDIYNELAGAWQVVLNNVDKALELTQAGKSGSGKSAAMSQFWGAHQRFFNQIITAMQTPCVIDDIRQQLDAGNVAVIQLVNTNEAAQERIIADATANDAALEDLDFTPRQMLMDYVRNGFPVALYEESRDQNGNTVYIPVKDSEGNLVFDREAIALRDALLETLQQIRVPENPLDSIINAFGSDRVAEITGRSRRFVQTRDEDGNLKVTEEKRGKNSSRADAEAFMSNKKDILVFSGAGGTGYSFHADNTAENKRRRYHYILQPGWRADAAVQGFGRTHRTNQANEPHYILPTTNLKAQKRFVSSIARRLDQLGALTRGQREATSQGMFTASDNLESQYAVIALNNFFGDLYRGKTDLSFNDVTKQMGLNLLDENGSFSETKIPPIPQFLNRLLSLQTHQQNAVFGEFEKRLIEAVEYAKQIGIFDVGLQTMTAQSIKKTRDDVAYEDKNTGAQTRYVELAVTDEIEYNDWEQAKKIARGNRQEGDLSGWFVSEFGKNKGDVFFLNYIGERLDSEGKPVHRGVVHTIKKHGHRYIDNADALNRGYDYRSVSSNGVGSYQKVTLTRAIDETEAERLWKEQLDNAPKSETKTERMIVGVILPIWDRVEGSETIMRLQTDDGEQLLGRMLGAKSAKQTIKNLGLESGLTNMSASDLFKSIRNGNKAILSNGWEIVTAKVNFENRIEIKGRGYLTDAEKRVLKDQGAFIERINWADRVFIPNDISGVGVFVRITDSKPVVDLIEKSKSNNVTSSEDEQEYGIPQLSAVNENAVLAALVDNSPTENKSNRNRQEVISMNDKKKPFHEAVAEKLIEQLGKGTAPWQKPWVPGEPGAFLPYNPITGNRYKGINAIHLLSQERDDQRWMTYKQATELGGQVLRGEKGTGIQYWKFTEEQTQKDNDGKPVFDNEGKPVKVVVRLERPRVFFATVFNAEQIEGLPPLQKKEQTWNPIERAEAILAASGIDIHHTNGGRAFYRLSTDSITLPDKGQFPAASNYYAAALHELGHGTGHPSRLNRDISHPFGSEGYAREELRAELASMILGDELGIGHDPDQHVAYVASWIKVLKEDPLEIFRAAADAEKIQGYVLGLEQLLVQEVNVDMNLEEKALSVAAHDLVARVDSFAETLGMDNRNGKIEADEANMQLPPNERDSHNPSENNQQYVVRLVEYEVGDIVSGLEAENPHAIGIYENMPDGTQNHVNDYHLSATSSIQDVVTQLNAGDITMNAALDLLRHHEVTDSEYDNIIANLNKESVAENRGFIDETHQLSRGEFALVANAVPLENHGRRWEIYVGERSFGFSDAATADAAITDAHYGVVNNALWSRSFENASGNMPVKSMPSERVLQDYPDLKEKFADVFESEAAQEVTILNVPFKEKEKAKALGAKWDRQNTTWYVPAGENSEPFTKWIRPAVTEKTDSSNESAVDNNLVNPQKPAQERQYLAVPYDDRITAKEAGAKWEGGVVKSWYVGPNANMSVLERWLPENVPTQQSPAMQPIEEFTEVLRELGFVVRGDHPIMDGKRHRCPVEGEEKKQNDKTGAGFYVAHLDGKPNGYAKNNKTGVEKKWIAKGYHLDPAEKAQIQAEAATKLRAREADILAKQQAVSKAVTELWAVAPTASGDHGYLTSKQARPGDLRIVPPNTDALPKDTMILIGADWKESKTLREENPEKLIFTAGDLLMSAQDADGQIWNVQSIQKNGSKCFAKDSKKEGCFHVVGGMDALAKAPALVIGEGYATADSLAQALEFATVAAFDSGNLPYIAKLLHEKFPDKPILIAGDDDLHQQLTNGKNPGKSKAEEAAVAVNGKAIFPIFAPGEQTDNPKGFSDFNDLATKSVLGKEGVKRQVQSVVDDLVKKHQAQIQPKLEQVEQQVRQPRKTAARA